ncbi:hypothetical protein H2200_006173 [Cladophialophora chaetospira]|uniref:Heterokaryon incompatibility domain-containing protein n=1 Tax=Cladophialophora chaetospira TaxID=386627 RepID=A0AA38XAF4_9EURO|nr:hypothetical protein H2200_006173 [Cladophialophora chaetospira]
MALDDDDGSFRHTPLLSQDSLRLLLLESRSSEGLVRCNIQQFEAQDAPLYRALSYHWGNPDPTNVIELNGHRKPIHDNLWQFLDQMTLDGEYSYYWTDALCIDQHNTQERNDQVKRMDEIYIRSHEVYVWLGRSEEMQSWMWLVESFYYFTFQEESSGHRNLTDHALDILRDERVIMHALPKAMAGLLNSTYFTRLWIIQELALAPVAQVRCGSFSLLLEHFEIVLGYCRVGKMASPPPGNPDTDGKQRFFTFREPPATSRALRIMSLHRSGGRELLWELLNEFSDARCAEPRDKIYGLLSLARPSTGQDRVRDMVGIDYGKQDLELFWDTLFECEAPFNWLTIMMSQLENHLHVAGTFEALDEYRRRKSVSTEHKRYALIATEVFWAIRSYMRGWFKVITTPPFDAMIAAKRDWGSESKEDNAVMIGLLLGTNQDGPKVAARRTQSTSQNRDEASLGGGHFGRWSRPSSQPNARHGIQATLCSMCNEEDFDIKAKRDWSELQVDAQFRIPGTECRLIVPKKQSHAKMWLETTRFALHFPTVLSKPVRQQQQQVNPRWGSPIARSSPRHSQGKMSRLFGKVSEFLEVPRSQ